jgi:hypothetical protein
MKEKYSHDALNKKLEGLPVPDEGQSWQKMKALLDKDEKNHRILTPFFLNCAGWTLFILLMAGGIFIFRPFSKHNSVSKTGPIETKNIQSGKTSQTPQAKTSSESGIAYDIKNKDYQNPGTKKDQNLSTKLNNKEGNKPTGSDPSMFSRLRKTKEQESHPVAGSRINKDLPQSIDGTTLENIVVKKDSVPIPGNEGFTQSINDSISENNIMAKKDSAQINDSTPLDKTGRDSLLSEKSLVPKKQKTPAFYLTVGLSFQQQLPLNGQSLNSYSVNGQKGALADYLPAIYLRLYKENKWFLQAGFRYSAPQATKEVSYRSTTTRNSVRQTTTIATLRLKKTFYRQVPFSFNYLLLPDFSFGAGGLYSRFESAVSENELKVRNDRTSIETVSKSIFTIPSNKDSVFTASQWHYLLQTEYSWKKWGVGLRYTGGLQPFMRFIENGIMKEEKNNSLQVFLRYDFAKSN